LSDKKYNSTKVELTGGKWGATTSLQTFSMSTVFIFISSSVLVSYSTMPTAGFFWFGRDFTEATSVLPRIVSAM
jgi:hypothetical protein